MPPPLVPTSHSSQSGGGEVWSDGLGSDGATAPHGARVHASLAHLALEGQHGVPMRAAIEQTGGRAYLALRQVGSGAAVAKMILIGLELVDIGEARVLIVPKLEPS